MQICGTSLLDGPGQHLLAVLFSIPFNLIFVGVDTCHGDSGGGMICEVRGRQSVLGLTSWGYGCGRVNRPGVYTKVANYLEWIAEKMTL